MTLFLENVTFERDKSGATDRDISRAQEAYGWCHDVTVRDVTHRDVTVTCDIPPPPVSIATVPSVRGTPTLGGAREQGMCDIENSRVVCVLCGLDGHRASACPMRIKGNPRKTRQDGIRTLADIKGRCVIDSETGCWLWRGAMSRSNVRKLTPTARVWIPADGAHSAVAGKATTAGKAAWLLAGKPLPDGHVVWRHVCTSGDCINPAHAKAGTRQDMHRAIVASNRLKGDPMRAAVNARNRMRMVKPESVVRQAEAALNEGEMSKDICARLGISHSTLQLIKHGRHPHSAGRQVVVRCASVFNMGL